MSFILDPPLLVASGAAIERAVEDEETAQALGAGTVALYIVVSLALYANTPGLGRIWRPFGARSGREFMLTSGLGPIDESKLTAHHHTAALSLFLLYPFWLWLGKRAARRH